MFLLGDQVVYSASDLAAAASCEFGLLRRLDAVTGLIPRQSVAADPMLDRTSTLGFEHERRQLEAFEQRFPGGVLTMDRPGRTAQELADAAWATFTALTSRTPVLYQATFFDGRFLGFCDFLVADGSRYTVYDTKLSRHAKVPALLQLAAYADALQAGGITPSEQVHLMLGDGSDSAHALADILPVYRQSRAHLQHILDEHHAEGTVVEWFDPRYSGCGQCDACTAEVEQHRDLVLVAGMRGSTRDRLLDAGISSIDELAESSTPVDGMSSRTLENLRAQAALQVRQERSGAAEFEIFDAEALGVIPEPDDGDIFFDFEGDPLYAESGSSDWGLEYLFGVYTADGDFLPFWAHDRAQERRALIDFLDYVAARRAQYPKMHVYHYAPYEKTALLRLAGRYGVGEDAVDDLLRENVLVDLYPVVRSAVRIGARSYSIKKLEPLYMPAARDGDVTDAAASIVEYAHWCELRDRGKDAEAAALLADIAEYNRTDCESTLRLRDWLLDRASDAGVAPRSPQQLDLEDVVDRTATPLELELAEHAGLPWDRTPTQHALGLFAGAIGYHRRENKPFWWGHYDRLTHPLDEWADAADVLKVERAELVHDWMKTAPGQRVLRRQVKLIGHLSNGVLSGSKVKLLYENPAPEGLTKQQPAHRATTSVEIVQTGYEGTLDIVVVQENLRKGVEEYTNFPVATAPEPPPNTKHLEQAIVSVATEVLGGLPELPRTAVADLLTRSTPRTLSGSGLPAVHDKNYAHAITDALLDLDNSYVAVQGPPGTGKTYTAARVIEQLVNTHHWRIGVVGQSHHVVNNLLDTIVGAGVDASKVGKKAPTAHTVVDIAGYSHFVTEADEGCVIGGTAWDFSNPGRIPPGSLDLLVVDEAGQFSLANTIAVSVSARNLLLLGDPAQLPQVSQGTHPEPVDESALGWLTTGHATLPADRGYFLATTWRMHPDLCAPVSTLSYEGKLESNKDVTQSRSLSGLEPGLHVVLLDHHGNSTDSIEEADEIVTRVRSLLGRPWVDPAHGSDPRPMQQSDFLVVAAYNAQVAVIVEQLAAAGLDEVSVGTVDKFQGRQAPVVLISMAASAIEDVPRGMGFLLSRNRLNVAISRGQWAAILVRSRALTHYLPSTPDGLVTLGTFMRLCENARQPNAIPSPR
ncbi:TM0106 family RecB-like putative nuclease [Rhodococcoides fascians]|uniref:TM0106 family RecB-like putative nuclease n=1 Tax=Rhodococcoides fascians TaxID=1828 RepID=UPI003899AAF9